MAAQSFNINLPGAQPAIAGVGPGSGIKATGGVTGAHADALMFAPSETGVGSHAHSTLCHAQL